MSVRSMVLTWVAMAELLQGLDNSSYDKPFFQRYFIQSFYSLGLPMWAIARAVRLQKSRGQEKESLLRAAPPADKPVAACRTTGGRAVAGGRTLLPGHVVEARGRNVRGRRG